VSTCIFLSWYRGLVIQGKFHLSTGETFCNTQAGKPNHDRVRVMVDIFVYFNLVQYLLQTDFQ
jgi:hypothetical protein